METENNQPISKFSRSVKWLDQYNGLVTAIFTIILAISTILLWNTASNSDEAFHGQLKVMNQQLAQMKSSSDQTDMLINSSQAQTLASDQQVEALKVQSALMDKQLRSMQGQLAISENLLAANESQAESTSELVKSSKIQALSISKSATIAEKQMRDQNYAIYENLRARVVSYIKTAPKLSPDSAPQQFLTVTLQNIGRQSAKDVTIRYKQLVSDKSEHFSHDICYMEQNCKGDDRIPLQPNEWTERNLQINKGEFPRFVNNKHAYIVIYWMIIYKDMLGKVHHSPGCYQYNIVDARWVSCAHFDGDD